MPIRAVKARVWQSGLTREERLQSERRKLNSARKYNILLPSQFSCGWQGYFSALEVKTIYLQKGLDKEEVFGEYNRYLPKTFIRSLGMILTALENAFEGYSASFLQATSELFIYKEIK